MLNEGNTNILKQGNKEAFNGHPDIPVGNFWMNNRGLILSNLKDTDVIAKNLIDEWNFNNNLNEKVNIFIEMLSSGNVEILKAKNDEVFKGHPTIPIGKFWHTNINRTLILSKLFDELMDDSSYDIARKAVLSYFKVNSIEKYYQMQEAKKKKSSEVKKLKKIKEELQNYQDSLEIDQKENRKRA